MDLYNLPPVEPNYITYYPELEDVHLEPFSITSYAGPPSIGTVVYIRNPKLYNEDEHNYSKPGRGKWVVKDSYESISVQGNLKDRITYRNNRSFEVILVPYTGED